MDSLKKHKKDLIWEKKWRNMIHQKAVKEEMNKQLKASLERQKQEEEEKECTFKPQTLWNQSFRKTVSFVDEFFVKLQPYIEQQQAYLNQLKDLEQEDLLFAEKVKEELRSMLSKAFDREIMEAIIEGYKGVRTKGMNKVKREKLDILSKMIKLEREYNCFMARENVDKKDLEECGFDCDLAAKLRNDILKESLCPNSLRDFAKIRQEINLVLEEELQVSENKNMIKNENGEEINMGEYEDEVEEEQEEEEEEENKEKEETGDYYYDEEEEYYKNKENILRNNQIIGEDIKHNIIYNNRNSIEKKGIGHNGDLSGIVNYKSGNNLELRMENGMDINEKYKIYEGPIRNTNNFIHKTPNSIQYNFNTLYKIDNKQYIPTDNHNLTLNSRNDSFHLEMHNHRNSPNMYQKKYSLQHVNEPISHLNKSVYSSVIPGENNPYFEINKINDMKHAHSQVYPQFSPSKDLLRESPNKQIPHNKVSVEKPHGIVQPKNIINVIENQNDKNNGNIINNNNKNIFLNNNYMKMLKKEDAIKYSSNWQKEASSMNLVILNGDTQKNTHVMPMNNSRDAMTQLYGMGKEYINKIQTKGSNYFNNPSSHFYGEYINGNANQNFIERNFTNKAIYAGSNNGYLGGNNIQNAYNNDILNKESFNSKNTKYVNKIVHNYEMLNNKNVFNR